MPDSILRPRSIAVVGASRHPNTIGYQVLDNLIRYGFNGPLYPVNPKADVIHSIRAYPSVLAIADPVDLAVIVVPRDLVLAAAEECGRKGVKGLVVITAGFAEVGGEGVERERRLVEVVRRYGMRMVGPNCMGVLNSATEFSMNATFAPTMPPYGPVGFISQSGAMGLSILDYAEELGIGIHQFVSVGNNADVSGNDLLTDWADDAEIRTILMYLESFGDARRFFQIARKLTRKKPIFVVKAGRTAAGARAASSHTAALAGTDLAADALMEQCGVMRAQTVEELFDYAMAFPRLPLPKGDRVAIISNAGGPAIILADACESAGLRVAELAPGTQAAIRRLVPEEAAVRNPVDLIASATAETFGSVLSLVLQDPNVDSVIVSVAPPPLKGKEGDVAEAIVQATAARHDIPVMAVLLGRQGVSAGMRNLLKAGMPGYIFPESAARALAAMNRYRKWLERPEGSEQRFPADAPRVARIVETARKEGREKLSESEALEVLDAYGVPTVPWRQAASEEEAVAAAAALGHPVVLKVISRSVVHKSDVGGVVVGLGSEREVREGYRRMLQRVKERAGVTPEAVLVQRMIPGGRETIVGSARDPRAGPLIMFGLGGVAVEVLKDVVFRVHPLTDVDAREMVRAIRGFPLLEGMRGEPAVDVVALEEILQRVSQLVGEHEAILDMDINPLVTFPDRALALDARFRIAL
ncbi:MAG TPA: acetate--CoA ligase family protein [Gemmatimonadales bacterium]|nr:acetate--CoA ligase family protein [Gemmatimonadales bacterium]